MKRLPDIKRRDFLSASTAAGAGLALTAFSNGAAASRSPNETLRVGIVGPGGRGSGLMADLFTYGEAYNARLTAVCDIWRHRRETATQKVKDTYGTPPKVYKHLDALLDDRDIDVVIIATADHQHARMLIQSVESGKDVYCEKPMANVLDEANRALQAVHRTGRIVQLGTQRRSFPRYRRAREIMQEGKIGEISKVEVAWNEYSPYRWATSDAELQACKKSDLDWPAFLMGKADRPFDPRIYRSFRLFRDFSSGIIDQWMTHGIDIVHFLTGHDYPLSAVAHGGIYHWRDYRENPDTMEAVLEYGQGNQRFLVSYASNLVNAAPGWWVKVMGTHGTLECENDWKVSGLGSKRRDALSDTSEVGEASNTQHHMANWLDAVRRQDASRLYAPAAAGHAHSVACIMTTDALWQGRRMLYDAHKQEIRAG